MKAHEINRRKGETVYPDYKLEQETSLPGKEVILNSTHNKKELVRNLCSSIDLPHTTMVGPSNTVHEEADVIIFACVNRAINEGKLHILVVSDDTDVFLLLLHYKWI